MPSLISGDPLDRKTFAEHENDWNMAMNENLRKTINQINDLQDDVLGTTAEDGGYTGNALKNRISNLENNSLTDDSATITDLESDVSNLQDNKLAVDEVLPMTIGVAVDNTSGDASLGLQDSTSNAQIKGLEAHLSDSEILWVRDTSGAWQRLLSDGPHTPGSTAISLKSTLPEDIPSGELVFLDLQDLRQGADVAESVSGGTGVSVTTTGPNGTGDVTVNVADAGVGNAQLTADAVYQGNIKDGEVTKSEIASASVGTDELRVSGVGNDQLATNSVRSDEIEDGSVGTPELAAGAVNRNALAEEAVGPDQITTRAVTDNLTLNSVGSSNLAANSVRTRHIEQNAVESREIGAAQVKSDNIDAEAIVKSLIGENEVGSYEIRDSSITGKHVAGAGIIPQNSVGDLELQESAIRSVNILDGTITSNKLANGSVGVDQLDADGSENSVLTHGISGITFGKIGYSNLSNQNASDNQFLKHKNGSLQWSSIDTSVGEDNVSVHELDVGSGSNGDVLTKSGGGLQWSSIDTSVGEDNVGVHELDVGSGNNGDVLKSNGSGGIYWGSDNTGSSGASSFSDLGGNLDGDQISSSTITNSLSNDIGSSELANRFSMDVLTCNAVNVNDDMWLVSNAHNGPANNGPGVIYTNPHHKKFGPGSNNMSHYMSADPSGGNGVLRWHASGDDNYKKA